MGPQHVEFRKEILQTISSWAEAPTWKLTKKSAYYNVQVGWAPTWRISKRNSTDYASWAGVPTWKLTKKSTSNISRI